MSRSGRALEPGTSTNPRAGREAGVPATLTTSRLGAYRAALTHLRWQRDQIGAVIEQLAALVAAEAPVPEPCVPIVRDELHEAARSTAPKVKAQPHAVTPAKGPASSHVAIVLDMLRKHPDGMRPKAIAAATSLTSPEVKAALSHLRHTRQAVASGATLTRTYRVTGKPNGKAAGGDEFEVAWSGSSKRPLTVQEPA